MDKIGLDGVEKELVESGFARESVDKYLDLFRELEKQEDGIGFLGEKLADCLPKEVSDSLKNIIRSVEATKAAEFEICFDPTLVRGMSYYTGTIFEIEMSEFNSSVGGGGRYDEMIGKFTGLNTPACGFSIGFERIITILLDRGFEVPKSAQKKAYLIEKGTSDEKLCEILKEARAERENGSQVLVAWMNKNKKFQKDKLIQEGCTEFKEFFNRD